MDKKQQLEKDLRQLQAEIVSVRIKKQNFERDTQNTQREKIRIIKSIALLRNTLAQLQNKQKALTGQINTAQAKIKAAESEAKKIIVAAKDKEKKAWLTQEIADDQNAKAKAAQAKNLKLQDSLKATNISLNAERRNLKKQQKELNFSLQKAKSKQKELDKLIESYQKEIKDIDKAKEESANLLEKAKELKAKLNEEIAGRGDREIEITRRERIQSDRDKQQDAREEKQNIREAKQDERQSKQDAKDQAIKRGLAELENQRIETKVLEGRVRKLIRDKNLKKELEKLESSLKT